MTFSLRINSWLSRHPYGRLVIRSGCLLVIYFVLMIYQVLIAQNAWLQPLYYVGGVLLTALVWFIGGHRAHLSPKWRLGLGTLGVSAVFSLISYAFIQSAYPGVSFYQEYGSAPDKPFYQENILYYSFSKDAELSRIVAQVFSETEANPQYLVPTLDSGAAYALGFSSVPPQENEIIFCGDMSVWVIYDLDSNTVKNIATKNELANQIRTQYHLDPYTPVTSVHQSGMQFQLENGELVYYLIFPDNGTFTFH